MRAFQDKETGKWKWGTRGQAIYETKEDCKRAGLDILQAALNRIKQKRDLALMNHGK